MTPEEQIEMQQLKSRLALLESKLNQVIYPERYEFFRTLWHRGMKAAVFGVTPVVQAAAIGAPNTQSGTYSQTDVQSIVTAVNSIRTAIKNFGITA